MIGVKYLLAKLVYIIMTNRRRFGGGGNERKKKSSVNPRLAADHVLSDELLISICLCCKL